MEKFQVSVICYIFILVLLGINFLIFCGGVVVGRIDAENRAKNQEILENSEEIKKFPTLEFPEPGCKIERIFKKFIKSVDSPIGKLEKVSYNRNITIGNSPNQKRITKVLEHFDNPDSKPNQLDLLLVLILSERIHLASGSSQQTKVRAHS